MEIRDVKSFQFPISPDTNRISQKSELAPQIASDQISLGQGQSDPGLIKLNILHMNDVHGVMEPVQEAKMATDSDVGGIAYAKTVVDQERAKNPEGTLVLNAGDLAEGSMVAYLTKGKVVTEALNQFKFDAIELGNHDFAWGQGDLKTLIQGLDAPILAANITKTDTGATMDGVKPYIMKDVQGVKVAIVGLDTPDMKKFVSAEKLDGLEFNDPAATLAKYYPEVKANGADLVVVLSHIGNDKDQELAKTMAEKGMPIDVIVGGHSHTVLPEGQKVGDTVIVQAGSLTQNVGNLQLDIDPSSKKIVNAKAQLIPIIDKNIQPDQGVQQAIAPYLEETRAIGARVMGHANEDLPQDHNSAAILQQVHADSLLDKTGAELCICGSRTLRGSIKEGPVTYKDLYTAHPMTEENYVTLTCTGDVIRQNLEDRIKDGGRGLTVPAGFKYTYDPSRPSGNRVVSITMPDGSPMDMKREYNIVTNITNSRNKMFANAKNLKDWGSSQDLFMEYFQAHSPWNNNPDDRVTVVKS